MKKMTVCLLPGAVLCCAAWLTDSPILAGTSIVPLFLLPLIRSMRTVRRLRRHLLAVRTQMLLLRRRCRERTEALSDAVRSATNPPAAERAPDGEGWLAAVEARLRVWNTLAERAYHTCNADRFLSDFQRIAGSADDLRSLSVLLRYAANSRYDGLADRLLALHPALTDYELDMLCMLRFGFAFNTIRLLHGHDNVYSIYSRRTKIHRKLALPRRYPIEEYLAELSGEVAVPILPEFSGR